MSYMRRRRKLARLLRRIAWPRRQRSIFTGRVLIEQTHYDETQAPLG